MVFAGSRLEWAFFIDVWHRGCTQVAMARTVINIHASTGPSSSMSQRTCQGLCAAGIVITVIVSIMLVVTLRFGSVWTAVAYLAGERLLVSPGAEQLVIGRDGEMVSLIARVYNTSDKPVELAGASATCTCAVVSGLPLQIPENEARDVRIMVHLKRQTSGIRQRVVLFTDRIDRPRLEVTFVSQIQN